MVINEKALVNQMKKAFKGGGYSVAIQETGDMVIRTAFWAVEIEENNVPREVLSLMALHMGFLPEAGRAWRILKGEKDPTVQEEIFETVVSPVRHLRTQAETAKRKNPESVKKTLLTFGGQNVWQAAGNLEIVLLAPEPESILRKKNGVIFAGESLYKEGAVSRVYLLPETEEGHREQIRHLGQMQWVNE